MHVRDAPNSSTMLLVSRMHACCASTALATASLSCLCCGGGGGGGRMLASHFALQSRPGPRALAAFLYLDRHSMARQTPLLLRLPTMAIAMAIPPTTFLSFFLPFLSLPRCAAYIENPPT